MKAVRCAGARHVRTEDV